MNITRRSLLHMIPAAAAAAPASTWNGIPSRFPLENGRIYLNAAHLCPASKEVLQVHAAYLKDFQSDPSFQNREKYDRLTEAARSRIASLVGASADEIAITRNTSEATNTVVAGLDLKAGDEIVITAHNHPSNNDSWKVRARRLGLKIVELPVPVPATSRQELIDAFERAITPRTRVLAFTHVTNTAGIRYPAEEICALGRRRGLWVHVDGAQTFGALNVQLHKLQCDSYSGSAHKWFMGPLEAGILYVREERIPQLWPGIVTAGWSEKLKGARKFEVYGQRDNPRLAALEPAAAFLEKIGMAEVESRVVALAQHAMKRLSALPGVQLKTSTDTALHGGVVKFDFPGKDLKPIYDGLYARHKVATSLTASGDARGIRFSAHLYNTEAQLDRAIDAVKELAG